MFFKSTDQTVYVCIYEIYEPKLCVLMIRNFESHFNHSPQAQTGQDVSCCTVKRSPKRLGTK